MKIMDSSIEQSIVAVVDRGPGVTFADLLNQVKGSGPDDVFRLLVAGKLYIDLTAAWLGERDRVLVFKDQTTAEFFRCLSTTDKNAERGEATVSDFVPGTTLLFGNSHWEVFHVDKSTITFHRKELDDFPSLRKSQVEAFIKEGRISTIKIPSDYVDRSSRAYDALKNLQSKEEMREALYRYEHIVKPRKEGKPITDTTLTSRTHRNVIKAYDLAEEEFGNGLVGLIRNISGRGNATDRLEAKDPRLRQFLTDFIDTEVEIPRMETKTLCYGTFTKKCKAEGIPEICFKTFVKAIKKRAGPEQTGKMKGSKAAYQEKEFLDADIEGWDSGVPVHGDYPWEYAHVDHTLMDVVLRHTDKGVIMGRAWITLLIDSFSRRVLAYYITYDAPSYRSCMGLIRECVRLHHRLPECLVVDGGKEFKSIYFMTLLARHTVNIIWRPATKPRFGAIIERFIHTLNEQFLHNLLGNTKATKNVRQLTKTVDPRELAVWTFPLLDEQLEEYLYREFANRPHSSLGQSPIQAFDEGIARFKRPEPPPIKYDDHFLIDTLPSTRKGTAKLLRSRGFKIYGVYYRSKKLRKVELYGKQLEVRYDPWNMAHGYAWDGKRWVICFAPKALYTKLKNRSEREVMCLTEEYRQLYKNHGRDFRVRAIEMAEKLGNKKDIEKVEQQRLRDQEMRASAALRGQRLSPSDNYKQPINQDTEDSDEIATVAPNSSNLVVFERAKRSRRS
jgi:putative transposase